MLQLLQIFGLFMVHYNIFAPVKPMLSGGDSFSDAFGKDGIAALLHQPTGGAGGTTDADGLDALQPLRLNLTGVFYQMAVGVHAQALVEKHLSIGTLTTTDKEDEIVLCGKAGDIRHAVGYRAADGVEALEGGTLRYVRLDIVDDAMELIERLRGLGVKIDVAGEIELCHLIEVLDNDGLGFGLANETKDLGMTFLAEDHDLSGILIILPLDALLELEHHRTGSIDDLDIVLTGKLVSLRGLTVGTQQHLHIMQLAHIVVVDRDQSHLAQAFALHTIVDDITETIEGLALCKFLLSFLNGGGHTEAETTAFIDFYLYHFFKRLKYSSNRSWAATNEVLCPAKTVCSAAPSCDLMSGLL